MIESALTDSYPEIDWGFPKGCGHLNAIRHFTDCIIKDQKPIVKIDDGIYCMKIIDAIYKSAKESKEIMVN